jgi:hypothetical protein
MADATVHLASAVRRLGSTIEEAMVERMRELGALGSRLPDDPPASD